MNWLNNLPNIEHKKLMEISKIKRGERITKKDLVDDGKYIAISGGNNFFGRINKFNREANTITIAQYGSAGFVNFQKEKFWANDVVYSIFPNINIINNKYLYYYLLNKQEHIYTLTTKALPNHLPIEKLNDILIPIPSIEIQNEIVKILDKYTELEKELEKELELRTKQYEYYRDKLFLNLYNIENVMIEPLWKVTNWNKRFNNIEKNKQQEITKFKSVSAKQLKDLNVENGNIKLLSTGLFDGYTNKELANDFICEAEIMTLPEGGNANIKYWNGEFVNSLNLIATSSNSNLYSIKFIYYFLIFKNKWIEKQYRGSNVKHPNMSEILELKIPIPSIQEQQKIVDILDKLSNIIKDYKDGIPRQKELIKKEYEYWRNKLLNFI